MSTLPRKILDTIKAHAQENPDDYVNPNLLSEIIGLIEVYSGEEDDAVDKWVKQMWGH